MKTNKYVNNYGEFLLEKKWSKKVHIDKGKMHEILGLKEDEKVTDKYKTGASLVNALLKATNGDREKVAGMINFAANVNPSHNLFDEASAYLKKSSEKEEKKDKE